MINLKNSLAVMQPYFLPYLGYFSLIDSVDHFVFFDDIQYQRKSWMSRNRLLNIKNGEPYYIRPDIEKPKHKEYLQNVYLKDDEKWKLKLIEQFKGYKNKLGFYNESKDILDQILNIKTNKLCEFNIGSTIFLSNVLSLKTKFSNFSDYQFWFESKPTAETWGFEVAKGLKVNRYINAPGGIDFILPDMFSNNNIKLGFVQPSLGNGIIKNENFMPGLSIIDVIAFAGIDKTREIIQNHKIKWVN